MSRQSRFKIQPGIKMKTLFLELQIDKEKKCKISFREMTRTSLMEYVNGDKILSMGVITYWNKKLAPYAPFPNEPVSESLAYRLAIEKGYFTEEEVPESDFTKDTMKIKNKLDGYTLMRNVELDIFGFTQNEMFSLDRRKKTLILSIGEGKYNKILEKNKKKLLKR